MNPLISTDRLMLRPFRLEDASDLYGLNLDPTVMRYTGDQPFGSVADAKKFVETYDHCALHGFGRWAVELQSSNTFIGWCGLKRHPDGMVDLGFRFLKQHWNKGYATEAAKACLEYGFGVLQLEEIVGRAARQNVASIRVLEKIGMRYWKDDACEGIPDSVYYKLEKQIGESAV